MSVHMVIDETAALGHFSVIDDMISMGRGYGLRIHLVFQSAAQMMKCYPDGQHQFILGTTTNIFMGARDWITTEEISKRSGQQTVVVESGGVSHQKSHSMSNQGPSTSFSNTTSLNWSYTGTPLIRPEQVAALPARAAITFAPGVPYPILTWVTLCHERQTSPNWKRRAWIKLRNFGAAAALLWGAFLVSLSALDGATPRQRSPPPYNFQPATKATQPAAKAKARK